MSARSRSDLKYLWIQRTLSVTQIHGISEHRHLPINGYFDIHPNFVKTQDHPSLHHFLFRSAYIVQARVLP